jgi:diaminopimelate decarboxylase
VTDKINFYKGIEPTELVEKYGSPLYVYEGDVLGVLDVGAYGYVMSSNYNNRLRPAEVLIKDDWETKIIRRRDTLEDLMKNYL